MKHLIITLLLALNVNAQLNTLSVEELQTKIEIDTKVETSKNYLMFSAIVTTLGFVSTTNDNISVLGVGAAIAGTFTTPYHFIRHRIYVHKRNKFYKKYNIKKTK